MKIKMKRARESLHAFAKMWVMLRVLWRFRRGRRRWEALGLTTEMRTALERSDRSEEAEGTSGGWQTGEKGDSEPRNCGVRAAASNKFRRLAQIQRRLRKCRVSPFG